MLVLVNHVLYYVSYDGWSDLSRLNVILQVCSLDSLCIMTTLKRETRRQKTILLLLVEHPRDE